MRKCKAHFMYLAVAGARMPHILKVFVLNAVQAAAKFGASSYGQHSMGSLPRSNASTVLETGWHGALLSLPLDWLLASSFPLGVKESQFAPVPWVLVFSLFFLCWVTEKLLSLVVNVKTVFACSWDRTTGSLLLRHHFVLVLGFLLISRGASAQIFYPCWCRKHSSGPQGKWWWWDTEAHVSVSVCLWTETF